MKEDNMNGKILNLETKHRENFEAMAKLKSRLDIAISATLPGISQNIAFLKNDMERQKHISGEMIPHVNDLGAQIEAQNKKLYKLNEFCNEFIQIKAEATKFLQKLVDMEKEYDKDLGDLKRQILNINSEVAAMRNDFKRNNTIVNDCKMLSDKFKADLENQNAKYLEDFKKEILEKVENIQMPYLESLDKEKKCIMESLDKNKDVMKTIHIDIENSILKSNNNEMQLKLIEKRIENILLNMKRIEMGRE